jgi:hypothetical protein
MYPFSLFAVTYLDGGLMVCHQRTKRGGRTRTTIDWFVYIRNYRWPPSCPSSISLNAILTKICYIYAIVACRVSRSICVPRRHSLKGQVSLHPSDSVYMVTDQRHPSIWLLRCKIPVRLAALNEFDRHVVFKVTLHAVSSVQEVEEGVSYPTDKYNRISALRENFSREKDTP